MENLGGYQPPYVQNNFGQLNKTPKVKKRLWPGVLLLMAITIYVATVSVWPAPYVTATTNAAPIAAENVVVPLPSYGTSAVGVLGGGVLASSSNQKPAPLASTAKVMTALAVLKQKPLEPGQQGPTITIDQADVDYFNAQVYEGGSTVPVTLGQKITERKALEMLLIPSANNIAYTLSRWAFGSTENYTKFANAYAEELGATNSNFTDPSGYLPTTTGNAHDLVLLGQSLMRNRVLAEIVKMKRVDLGNGSSLPSTNSFLTLKPDVIGIKTGHHDQSGGCFIVAVESKAQNGEQIVTVSAVIGAPNLIQAMNDSYAVAQATAAQIGNRRVINSQQVLGAYTGPWGDKVDVAAKANLSALLWKGSEVEPKITLEPIKPSPAGTRVGKANVTTVNGQVVSVEANLQQELPSPSFFWRLTNPLKIFVH
jgi:D-alanyl-D-alanine carboxypeptidase (penicillin-binding protein 5/6)